MRIQTEVNEWMFLPETGELVEVAAKKKHTKMKEDQVTDFLEGGYVFSDAKFMTLAKKDFQDLVIEEELPQYKEGEKPKEYTSTSFADKYFTKDKQTPAAVIKSIQRNHKLIMDEEQKYNPYIQKANDMNRENRQQAIDTIISVSETLKPQDTGNNTLYPENSNPQGFKSGGWVKGYNPPKAFWGAIIGAAAVPLVTGIGSAVGRKKNAKAVALEKNKAFADYNTAFGKLEESGKNQLGVGRGAAAMQLMMPNSKAEVPNYNQEITNLQNAYTTNDFRTRNAGDSLESNSLANTNALMRNYASSANPGMYQNSIASAVSQGVQGANQSKIDTVNTLNNSNLSKVTSVNMYEKEMKDALVNSNNNYNKALEDKYRTGVNDFANNETAGYQMEGQLAMDNFQNKLALEDRYKQYLAEKNAQTNANWNGKAAQGRAFVSDAVRLNNLG